MKIGTAIRKYYKNKGMNQKQFAGFIDYSANYLSQIVTGATEISEISEDFKVTWLNKCGFPLEDLLKESKVLDQTITDNFKEYEEMQEERKGDEKRKRVRRVEDIKKKIAGGLEIFDGTYISNEHLTHILKYVESELLKYLKHKQTGEK